MRRLSRLLVVLTLVLLIVPGIAAAQESDWRERPTEHFAILYIDGDQATSERYAGFVDAIYDEVAAIFGHRTATPITLRLYPSLARYQESNPLARGLTGVVAHADFRRHELVVVLSQTESQTPEEVRNNIRHELTHLVAAELSDDRLNVGFQEGLAQYVERPAPELETRIKLLQRAATGAAGCRSRSGHQWFTQPASSQTSRRPGSTERPKSSMFSKASSCGIDPITTKRFASRSSRCS